MDPCDIRAEGKPRCSEQRGCTGPIVGHRSRFPIHSRMREWPELAHLVRCGEFRRSSPFWTQRSPQSTAADRKGSVVQTTQPGANRAHHVSGTGSSNPFPSSEESNTNLISSPSTAAFNHAGVLIPPTRVSVPQRRQLIGSNACPARGTRFAVAKLLRERDLNLEICGYPRNLG